MQLKRIYHLNFVLFFVYHCFLLINGQLPQFYIRLFNRFFFRKFDKIDLNKNNEIIILEAYENVRKR